MSKQTTVIVAKHEEEKLRLASYVYGYVGSLAITLTAYLAVYHRIASADFLIGLVVVLALSQFALQIYFFLHLGRETKPRWKLAVFLLMVTVVMIIVGGSLWIMNNLNTRMTIPEQTQYMNDQDGL